MRVKHTKTSYILVENILFRNYLQTQMVIHFHVISCYDLYIDYSMERAHVRYLCTSW